jgi:hypothetical protein
MPLRGWRSSFTHVLCFHPIGTAAVYKAVRFFLHSLLYTTHTSLSTGFFYYHASTSYFSLHCVCTTGSCFSPRKSLAHHFPYYTYTLFSISITSSHFYINCSPAPTQLHLSLHNQPLHAFRLPIVPSNSNLHSRYTSTTAPHLLCAAKYVVYYTIETSVTNVYIYRYLSIWRELEAQAHIQRKPCELDSGFCGKRSKRRRYIVWDIK